MATKTVSAAFVAPDGMTWSRLTDGEGWTRTRILKLRQLAAVLEGHKNLELPRDQFGKLTGTTERSLARWENEEGKPLLAMGRQLGTYAQKLDDQQRVALLQS